MTKVLTNIQRPAIFQEQGGGKLRTNENKILLVFCKKSATSKDYKSRGRVEMYL